MGLDVTFMMGSKRSHFISKEEILEKEVLLLLKDFTFEEAQKALLNIHRKLSEMVKHITVGHVNNEATTKKLNS